MIDSGADVEHMTSDGWNALKISAQQNSLEVAKVTHTLLRVQFIVFQALIMDGANIETKDGNGWTALHAAAKKDSVGVAKVSIC